MKYKSFRVIVWNPRYVEREQVNDLIIRLRTIFPNIHFDSVTHHSNDNPSLYIVNSENSLVELK